MGQDINDIGAQESVSSLDGKETCDKELLLLKRDSDDMAANIALQIGCESGKKQVFDANDYMLENGFLVKIDATHCNDFSIEEIELMHKSLKTKGVFIVKI